MTSIKLRSHTLAIFLTTFASVLFAATAVAQMTPDQQAEMLINSARKAYNEKNYGFATMKFREYLGKFGDKKDAASARYGLALTLIEGPEKKFDEARDLMQALAGNKDFADRALAAYYAGVAHRGLGLADLAKADAQPAQAVQFRTSATQHFGNSIPLFTTAITAFLAKVEKAIENDKVTLDAEWVARARCDLAEMQLRVGKYKEAQASAAPFVADPVWSKSQYHPLGRYLHGYASVLAKDNVAAQKSLSLLAPFEDPVYGNHARYLLARTHHLADERAEATAHYEGTIADYAKNKANAAKMLQQPETFKNDPEIRARLESLVKNPTPDHVARSIFYVGALHFEGGKFSDAKTRFVEFVKQFPQSPLRHEAEVRAGYCQVQLKEYPDAVKTLTPLVEKEPRLADQVLFWLGKAQAGTAPDPAMNQQQFNQVIAAAINTLRGAATRAQQLENQDPDAKVRRGEILLEMADQMQRVNQNKESAAVYNQLLNDKLAPDREEEITQRLTNALHLAGDYNESDKACVKFQERFPQSTLTPAVLFVYAENSFFRVVAVEKNPNQAERAKELAMLYPETIKRFQTVIAKYPEFPRINVARYSLGLTQYRSGDLPAALKTLNGIPAPERTGELGLAHYLIADCTLRQVPVTTPEDALAAGKMEEQLKSASESLEAFIAGLPKDSNVPDALLKLGLCQQRLAGLIVQPQERVKKYNEARATYEKVMRKDFGVHPIHTAYATFERAKCITLAGDMNTGINELRKFTTDPLRQTAVAPQAILQLATYLRTQNKPAEAVDVFVKNREFVEGILAKDPEKDKAATMTALLRYHHGVALREFGKLPEARAIFDSVVKMGIQRPEATESALRIGQCLKDEGQARLDAARKMRGNIKEAAQAQKIADEGYKSVRDSVAFLEGQAELVKANDKLQETRGRMMYEAAWGHRILAEPEIAAAKSAIQQEMSKKLNAPSSKFPLPDVPLDKVPLQASEKKARAIYKSLIDQVGDIALATEARFELAEMLADRNEYDPAIALLNEVLDKEPGPELTEKVRLRLGGVHAGKGNLKGALQQFDAVAANAKSPLYGWAQYRAGEALIDAKQYTDAVKRLVIFRDQGQWQNVAGLSDRALLRLGYCYALLKSWGESRTAYERLVNAFPGSPWLDEGRYGMGWAFQQEKNFDAAANVYGQVVGRTATETAAKAQLQIGLCRMEQKRYADAANAFLVIPTTYDYAELRAAALLEAGKAYLELKQVPQANQQFERIIREFPNTPWAEAAKEKMKK